MVVTKEKNTKVRISGETRAPEFFWLRAIRKFDLVKNISDDYDILVLGDAISQVNPRFYGDRKTNSANITHDLSRDMVDSYAIARAIVNKKKIIAVGRSAHLACLAAGGKLIQHADGHIQFNDFKDQVDTHHKHSLIGIDGYKGDVSSYHHGIMFPFLMDRHDYSILGYTTGTNRFWYYENNFENDTYLQPPSESEYFNSDELSDLTVDPEAVYFRNINCLAIQFDPMHLRARSLNESYKWIQAMTSAFLDDKL